MSRPRQRSQLAERLLVEVETSPGSGQFAVDWRLRAEQVEQMADERMGRATISVLLDEALTVADAVATYQPERRLVIRTDSPEPAARQIIFAGYPMVQESRWDGRPGRGDERYSFEAEGILARVGRDGAAQIVGRRVRNGLVADGLANDPQAWADRSVVVEALPCIFNLDGKGNCDPTPLIVPTADGGTRSIHIFSDDGDPNAVAWTLARILRYLVYFYLPSWQPVDAESLLARTDAYAEDQAEGREGLRESDPLGYELRAEPVSLTCEAANVVEALVMVADAAGCHFACPTRNEGRQVRSELVFWSPLSGPKKWLYLARGGRDATGAARYETSGRSAEQIFADNNVSAARLRWDWRGLSRRPLILGAVKKYEMTVPMVPGWQPVLWLDNVSPADRDEAKARALLPEDVKRLGDAAAEVDFFKRYHRRGAWYGLYGHVSRRWVLNEHGRYEGFWYNRNAPFDDYQPFDFSTVCQPEVTTRGAWMRRARRFLPTISPAGAPAGEGVWVQISFDAGQTWHLQSGGVRVLSDECGIFMEFENPCQITPPGVWPDEQNLWYALIDQTCRVRVTAVIEADERLRYEPSPTWPSVHVDRRVVYRPRDFEFVTRQQTTNVLRELNPADGALERDDTLAMAALAEQLSRADQQSLVHAWPVIPWLDVEYQLGDRIAGIRGRDVAFSIRSGDDGRLPNVVGKVYRSGAGRYETRLLLG